MINIILTSSSKYNSITLGPLHHRTKYWYNRLWVHTALWLLSNPRAKQLSLRCLFVDFAQIMMMLKMAATNSSCRTVCVHIYIVKGLVNSMVSIESCFFLQYCCRYGRLIAGDEAELFERFAKKLNGQSWEICIFSFAKHQLKQISIHILNWNICKCFILFALIWLRIIEYLF